MPLIRRDAKPTAPNTLDPSSDLDALRNPDPDARWNAARGVGSTPASVPALAAALETEQVPRVREALITALMQIGGETSAKALLPYLRSQDAARRGAAMDALQSMPNAVAPFLPSLLSDPDIDVRILAIELVRGIAAAAATALLCEVVDHDENPNVCASAVDALAEIGTSDALPALERCARRFTKVPFLPFAISTATARIASSKD